MKQSIKTLFSRILYIFFVLLPVFDSINGVLVRRYSASFGAFYHVLLTIFLLCGMFIFASKTREKRIYFVLFTVGMIVVTICVNVYFFSTQDDIDTDLLLKFICTLLDLLCLCQLVEASVLSKDFCSKVLETAVYLIPILIIIAKLTGWGNVAYISSDKGFLGFYNSSNELNFILLILFSLSLNKLFSEKKITQLIGSIALFICVIMIESKISIGIALITILLYLWKYIKEKISTVQYIKPSTLLLFLVSIIVIYKSKDYLQSSLNSFQIRQQTLMGIYIQKENLGNLINYITSGRTVRIVPLYNEYFKVDNAFPLWDIIRILIGNGYVYQGGELCYLEMELFDMFLWNGLIGLIWYIVFVAGMIRNVRRRQRKNFYLCLPAYIALACSVFAGHVLFGGVAGIYFALLFGALMYDEWNAV